MARKNKVKILFIGNSHTYYHDLPAWVALMAKQKRWMRFNTRENCD